MDNSNELVGKIVEGYRIIKFLGRGKFSTVYQAERQVDQKLVALKIIKIYDIKDKDTIDKCLQEVNLLQKVNHPNIVKYIDSFISQNELYIAIEWADKGDLKRMIKKYKQEGDQIEEAKVVEYTREIASALDHMHGKRVIHRDLKPANILIFSDGTFKLGDLGLGRFMSDETFKTFSRVGTPLYMAPEVIESKGYDFKSDNWSLGCVVYELITLKSPFQTDAKISVMDLFKKISTGQYPKIKDNNYAFSSNIVDSLLKVNPEQRADLSDVIAKCQKYLDSQEEKPKIDPFIVMDDIIEKLRLINYENNFCKKYNKELLTKFYFAFSINGYNYNEHVQNVNISEAPENDDAALNNQENNPGGDTTEVNQNNASSNSNNENNHIKQFSYFYDLSNWLMIIIKQNVKLEILQEFDIKFKKYDKKKPLEGQLNELVTDLKSMDVKVLQNSKFKYGYGEGVCLVLTQLCDKYLIKQNFIFKKPKFKENKESINEIKSNFDDFLQEDFIGTNIGFKANTNYNFNNFKSAYNSSGSKSKFFIGTNKKRFNSAVSVNDDTSVTTDFSNNNYDDDVKIPASTLILQSNIEPAEWSKELVRVENMLTIPEVPEYLESQSESSIKGSISNNINNNNNNLYSINNLNNLNNLINNSNVANDSYFICKKINSCLNYTNQLKIYFGNLNEYVDKIEIDLNKITNIENYLSKSPFLKNAIGKIDITNKAIQHYKSDIQAIQENIDSMKKEKNEIFIKLERLNKKEEKLMDDNEPDKAIKIKEVSMKLRNECNRLDIEIGLLNSACFMNAKIFNSNTPELSVEEKMKFLENNDNNLINFENYNKPVFDDEEVI